MRFDFFRSPFRSRIAIAYILPGGLVLSGVPAAEDASRAQFSVSVEARRKHFAGLTYVAQIAPGLFSYRFDDAIILDPSDAKVHVHLFLDGERVGYRRIDTGTFFGALDGVEDNQVRGWVSPAFRGLEAAVPELVINGAHRIPIICTRYRMDLSPLTAGDPLIGFQLRLPASTPASAVHSLEIRAGERMVAESTGSAVTPIMSLDEIKVAKLAYGEQVAEIRRLKAEIRDARLRRDIPRLRYLRQRLLHLRGPNGSSGFQVSGWPAEPAVGGEVSVIVPVYRDLASLRRCMDHLLASRRVIPFEILVVNDCSPDADVRRYLKALSLEGAITLLENEHNLGFVGSVNAGLNVVASEHDVVLLNSDAFVPLRWLEKLSAIAYSEPNVASVTPMSNAATIFSYPRPNRDNPMPPETAVEVLDERFSRAAEMLGYFSVEVPTGVGFCMYLTRQALAELGGFAEEFSPGYGEENDWCKRAEDCGLRNLGAANTFVEHLGSVSFSEKRAELIRNHMNVLNARYPEYMPEVMDFIQEDPFGVFRAAVDLLAQVDNRPTVVHLLHGWGGGIAEHIADIRRHTSDLALHIAASSDRDDENAFNIEVGPLEWSNKIPKTTLLTLLGALKSPPYIHFHTTIGMTSDARELTELPSASRICTIHDYSLRCPRIFLLSVGDKFCGLPDIDTCERCIHIMGPLKGLKDEYSQFQSVHHWVAEGERFLSSMDHLTFPSRDLASRFPLPSAIDASVVPHPEAPIRPFSIARPRQPLRVGILGAIGVHKGSRELRELAENIELRDLPIKLFVAGYTDDDRVFEGRSSIVITGPYEKRMAGALLQSLNLDFILIPSIWPETYSFTVSEAWRSGLPVMTLFKGGHSDRVMDAQGFGYMRVESLQPKEIIEAILAFAGELEKRAGDRVQPAVMSPSDWFETMYLGATRGASLRRTGIEEHRGEPPAAETV
jgi:GT2 family glycosyltransferase/glycosyltransferase involved in cell wall biosynthesis